MVTLPVTSCGVVWFEWVGKGVSEWAVCYVVFGQVNLDDDIFVQVSTPSLPPCNNESSTLCAWGVSHREGRRCQDDADAGNSSSELVLDEFVECMVR